jgi:acetyl-CoA carboxylase carboxyl transferase subunit alpha
MLEFSIYAVISPEGCAAILWSDGTKGAQAAEALKLTANDIKELEVIDEIVKEPPGGAHCDHAVVAKNLAEAISRNLQELRKLSPEELVQGRYDKFRKMSRFLE